ncbi:MAG: TonB-dependent receptor [bacterium]
MLKKFFILFSILLFTMCISVYAQNYGKISGQVVEESTGEPLVGANVMVENTQMGAATDSKGRYVILQVEPGVYNLKVSYMGYQTQRMEEITVRANRITYADFKLQEETVLGETVVITADRLLIEKDNTATLRSISSEEITDLPSSTVSDILRVQPGIVNRGGLHLRGGRSGEITYMIDGVPISDPLFSSVNTSEILNRNIISEMQVISGTYSAEYGNAMSGIINITTKEGAAEFSAEVDAKSTALGIEEESIKQDRHVIRTNFSGSLFSPETRFMLSTTYDDRDSYLPWGYRRQGNVFFKITDRHIDNVKLNFGANLSQGKRKSYSHSYKYIPDQAWYEPNTNSQMFYTGLVHTLADNLYYDLTLYYQFQHYDSGDYDYQDLSPAYQRDENKEFYLLNYVSGYSEDDQETVGIRGNMLWQTNNYNEIKAGFEYRSHRLSRFYISSPYYDDHILDDYTVTPYEFSAYIQDKINFSSIILSAGMRYDLTAPDVKYWENPYDLESDTTSKVSSDIHTQISPRLGISYPVSDKTVFHFGYGHYFERPEYQFIYKTLVTGDSEALYDVDGDGDVDYADNMLMNLRSGNGRFGDPNLKPQKTIAYEFGLSNQIFEDYLLKVSVYSKRITNLVGARTFYAGDRPEYWETFSLHINDDFAYNNGLEIQFRKIRGRYFSGEINYTYSVHEGSSSGPLERVGIEEANRQTLKFFPLDFDQRHVVNAYLTIRLREDDGPKLWDTAIFENLRTTLLFEYGSGFPYTRATRGATEPYEINNERLPPNWTFDLKMDKRFSWGKLTLIPYLEIYNLTNRKNVEYVDPFTGKPDEMYGRTYEYAANPLNWGMPRMIYLGMSVQY